MFQDTPRISSCVTFVKSIETNRRFLILDHKLLRVQGVFEPSEVVYEPGVFVPWDFL